MKKVLSVVLALVLVIAIAAPAFATSSANTATATFTGTTEAPIIKLNVPKTGTFKINPYQMAVAVGEDESQDQIISTPVPIVNESNIALDVNFSLTATVAGNAKLVTEIPEDDTKNDVHLQMKFETVTGQADPADLAFSTTGNTVKTIDVAAKVAADPDNKQTLAAKAETRGTDTLLVGFTGEAATAPTTPWSTKDTVTVAVAFTFAPVAETVTGG